MKTPQLSYPKLAEALHCTEVFLKREDLHPYGSHKGRSIPLMIKEYLRLGKTSFVISSSGNAARAAVHTLLQHNKNNPTTPIWLRIFLGMHVDPDKEALLMRESAGDDHIIIERVERPKQTAFEAAKKEGVALLRQSTDDLALLGYESLGEELLKINNLQAVFIPTSSGTTAQGLAQYFLQKKMPIEIHIVQTSACHPLTSTLDPEPPPDTETSFAHAIVDRVANRKDALLPLIKETHGGGWIVTDEEITNAISLVKTTCGLTISPNSALSVAGLTKAVQNNLVLTGAVVCLITGI